MESGHDPDSGSPGIQDCQLVASCDIAVASDKSTFATPGVSVGLFCSTPAVAIGRALPRKVVMEMLLTGRPISAQGALLHGLLSKVVCEEQTAGLWWLSGRVCFTDRCPRAVRVEQH